MQRRSSMLLQKMEALLQHRDRRLFRQQTAEMPV